MDTQFLKLLVCPLCNIPLRHDRSEQELICQHDQLAYPIRNGIPVMLKEEARSLRQNQAATSPQRPLASGSPESPATPASDRGHSDATASGQAKPAIPDTDTDTDTDSGPGSESGSNSDSNSDSASDSTSGSRP
ncbi:hypothetical protein CAP48_13580 [Advenella sp. S44]|nr:hypothetical protein CAP48_13580 [Advenella sp. S44]